MTGFGQGSAAMGAGRVVAEARAVNGRFLDVRVRMARELSELAVMVEAEARKRLSRGRLELVFRLEGAALPAPSIHKERAAAAYASLVELSRELGAGAEVPFSMLSALPDLFVPALERDHERLSRAVLAALGGALDDLDEMREKEGRAMGDELARRVRAAEKLIEDIAHRAPEVLEVQAHRFRDRLGRVAQLIAPSPKDAKPPTPIDPARLEQELLLLVERSDVSEELTRLRIHAERFLSYLGEAEPLGRRLDFLLQEMAREINTIGAKSQDFGIAHHVVELKAEIEKMRELVQNVE
jgi:uncharacterized protein (TIGR00255 family)